MMTKSEAITRFKEYVANQRIRDRSGHAGHIVCGCPSEDIESLDAAVDMLSSSERRELWQEEIHA